MKLKSLVKTCDDCIADIEIKGITSDSREVRPGYLFAAIPGHQNDGRDFIEAAIKAGAVAILCPLETDVKDKAVAVIEEANPRAAFAMMAARFYGRQPQTLTAVTGTNGKSSTVNFCRQMWQSMEHAAASLGTLGITAPGISRPGTLTTPDPVTLHAELAELEAAGVTHLAMEASSQGLDQYRLDGVHVTASAFINLTRDHLDYHGTMDEYFLAKARLFTEVMDKKGVAVINADDPYAEKLEALCQKRGIKVISFGKKGRDIQLLTVKPLPDGQFIEISVFGERYTLELPLVGSFQTENALCALGLVIAQDPNNRLLHMQAVYALERLQSVRGRFELAARHPNGAAIYVDYAHTPDGLETMLKAARPHAHGKLHVIFGCGGDRDKGKRPLMGEIATRLADVAIVTDDNPRTEDAATIRREIMAAAKHGTRSAEEIGDRKTAIHHAIKNLGPDDVLIIAGKGHEQGQIIGRDILPFDDVSVAKTAVQEMMKNGKR